jgi:hypothetical protein
MRKDGAVSQKSRSSGFFVADNGAFLNDPRPACLFLV